MVLLLKRNLVLTSTLLLLVLTVSGCETMVYLLGDTARYSVSGDIRPSDNMAQAGISSVTVAVECPGIERAMWQNKKGRSDENGKYTLRGKGTLQDCKLIFSHPAYYPETIPVGQNHLTTQFGLSFDYRVNALLTSRQ